MALRSPAVPEEIFIENILMVKPKFSILDTNHHDPAGPLFVVSIGHLPYFKRAILSELEYFLTKCQQTKSPTIFLDIQFQLTL